MSAAQMAILFVLTVLMAVLYTTPELLIATVQFANEGSLMMKETMMQYVQPVATMIVAIWCGCMANGKIPV
ncbi:hypothetical protein [Pseudomonas trivialis]|uniref:Uncharacterized protein n=1 Tax=Pseudomonas trivialis TaxID=200450 RepID=A0A0R2ZI47_9PSED|nr:hypothetical protein [Pseudomonas trivialis]KRP60322.1 hypothetical protein TU79_10795 [Pseudomonas trivialis]